ncbi:hypothetical protein [Frigoribacterium salinisoli]
MSDPQQPGEGAQAPKDPTATPPSTTDQGPSVPPPAPYQRPAGDTPFAAPLPPQAGSEADDPTPGAYAPPSYQPGQPSGSSPVPSSSPQPPAGSVPEAPPAPGYGAYPAPGQGAPAYAAGYPGSAQIGGPGQPGGPGYPGGPGQPGGYPGQPGGFPGPPTSGGGRANGLVVAAVVVGGLALLFSWVPVFGLLLGLAGLALGIVAVVRKAGSRVLAWVGTGLSILATLIGIVVLLVTSLFVGEVTRQIDDGYPEGSATAPAEPTTPDDASDGSAGSATGENAAFGDTWQYDDGLTVTVSAPEPYTPSEYASGADQAEAVVFTITIENGTEANFDPSLSIPNVSSGGTEASRIVDFEGATGLPPSTTVPSGQSVSWQAAFSVVDPEQIVLDVAPSFDHDAAVFTS